MNANDCRQEIRADSDFIKWKSVICLLILIKWCRYFRPTISFQLISVKNQSLVSMIIPETNFVHYIYIHIIAYISVHCLDKSALAPCAKYAN